MANGLLFNSPSKLPTNRQYLTTTLRFSPENRVQLFYENKTMVVMDGFALFFGGVRWGWGNGRFLTGSLDHGFPRLHFARTTPPGADALRFGSRQHPALI
jgi:hypothetical protein